MMKFSLVTETEGPLRTFDDLFVYFKCVGQESEIQIQEAIKNQDKGKMFPFVCYVVMANSKRLKRLLLVMANRFNSVCQFQSGDTVYLIITKLRKIQKLKYIREEC